MAISTTLKQNRQLVRRFVEDVFNGREYDALEEFWASDYVQHGPGHGVEMDRDTAREHMEMIHSAFPDVDCVEEACVCEGDWVASHYTYRGTHEGEFNGIEPTGIEAEIGGMVLNRIEDGRIAESWVYPDFMSLMEQLGAFEAPGHEHAAD